MRRVLQADTHFGAERTAFSQDLRMFNLVCGDFLDSLSSFGSRDCLCLSVLVARLSLYIINGLFFSSFLSVILLRMGPVCMCVSGLNKVWYVFWSFQSNKLGSFLFNYV